MRINGSSKTFAQSKSSKIIYNMEKLDDAHIIDGFHFDYRIFLNLSSPK